MDNDKMRLMTDIKQMILDYFTDDQEINEAALKALDTPITDSDPEVRRMREIQAMLLRDRNTQISRHIAVIKRMLPTAIVSKPATAKRTKRK